MLIASLLFFGLFATIISAITSAKQTIQSFRISWAINAVISCLYCWAILSIAHFLSMILFRLGGEWLFAKRKSPRLIWLVAIASAFLGHAVVGATSGVWYVWKISEIENSLPSIAPEELSLVRSSYPSQPAFGDDSNPVDKTKWDRNHRNLETVHHSTLKRFLNAPGFGRGRMQIPSLTMYEEKAVGQPKPLPLSQILVDRLDDWALLSPGDSESLVRFHGNVRTRFTTHDSLGVESSTKRIVGFRPHGIDVGDHRDFDLPPEWSLAVELVGLLMAESPRVYQTKNFPTMTEAKESPTRPLDAFESWGLAEIAKGHSTVAMKRRDGTAIRMVGAIRANDSCVKCHGCQPGDLLGMMSYSGTNRSVDQRNEP